MERKRAIMDHKPDTIRARTSRQVRGLLASPHAIAVDLLILFAVALAVRLIWSVVMPPWQATDETEHFAYVNHIVEQHALPHRPFDRRYAVYSKELQASLDNTLFYPLVRDNRFYGKPSAPLPTVYDYQAARTYSAMGDDRFDSGGARAGPYPPLYYLLMAAPDLIFIKAPIVSRLFAMRASTAILGALSCVFAYLMAYEFQRTRRWGWAVGLCVAFMPTYAQLTASVNNDAAVVLGAMALLWLVAVLYRRRAVSLPLASAVGIASAVTMLMKPTAFPVIAIAGIVLVGKAFPFRASLQSVQARLSAIGVYALTGCVTYAPWLFFRLSHGEGLGFGTTTLVHPFLHLSSGMDVTPPLATIGALSPIHFSFTAPHSLGSYLRYLRADGVVPKVFNEFWARFGWGGAFLPNWAMIVVTLCCAVGAIGVILQLCVGPGDRGMLLLLLSFLLLQTLFLFFGADYYQNYAQTGVGLGLQGRYFFPILLPLLFLIISGWHYLFRMHTRVLRFAPLVMFALQIVGLAAVLTRYYGIIIR